jgi:hypothetical protein
MKPGAGQAPIRVRCECGWEGTAPNDLIPIAGTTELACPQCQKMFAAWPFPNKNEQH